MIPCCGRLLWFCPSLCSFLSILSLANASVISTQIMTRPFFFVLCLFVCFQPCKIPLHLLLNGVGLLISALLIRLHGCCSWCRFALSGKLKEKKETGDGELNQAMNQTLPAMSCITKPAPSVGIWQPGNLTEAPLRRFICAHAGSLFHLPSHPASGRGLD